jgi:hypothetical protein
LSDIAQGPGWWLASDGKWYPPRDESQAPAPGWWLASDGKWYPPMESEEPPEADWWLASDGKWYPPDRKPGTRAPAPATAPTWASAADAAWAPPDAGREPVKPVPAAPRPPGAPARPPVKPIPAPSGRTPAPREPAKPPAPVPPAAAPRPPVPPAANRPVPAAPPTAPPAPPASRPPLAPITRPTRASNLEGQNDDSGRSALDQKRAQDEQSKKDAAVLVDARRMAAMRALGTLGVLKDEAGAEAQAPAPAPPPPVATAAVTAAPPPPPERPATGSGSPPLLEIIPSQVLADDARTATRLSIHDEHVELRNRTNEVVRRIPVADITNVAVNKRFTGTSVTIESSSGAPVVARGLRPDQADEIRALLVNRRAPAAAGFMEAPAPGPEAPTEAPPAPTPPPPPTVGDTAAPAEAPDVHLDEADLVAKLVALRDAGVLTDAEYDEKVERVNRLTRGESLAVTTAPGA